MVFYTTGKYVTYFCREEKLNEYWLARRKRNLYFVITHNQIWMKKVDTLNLNFHPIYNSFMKWHFSIFDFLFGREFLFAYFFSIWYDNSCDYLLSIAVFWEKYGINKKKPASTLLFLTKNFWTVEYLICKFGSGTIFPFSVIYFCFFQNFFPMEKLTESKVFSMTHLN